MNLNIPKLLEEKGPGLSSEFIEVLQSRGLSPAAARQRLTRAKDQYKRLAGIRFAKNRRFMYLEKQYGTKEFWDALERAFRSSGISYWSALAGLRARGGQCPKSLFPIVCGAPIRRRGQISPEHILERLCAIQLLKEIGNPHGEEPTIEFEPIWYGVLDEARLTATSLAEEIALYALRDWARRIGLGSYNKFRLRLDENLPVVSGIAWDMSAPSYVRPLSKMQGGTIRPGFIVCDINLNGPVTEELVDVFVRKHTLASAPHNVAPIMPFLIGDRFNQSAFDRARQSGIIATTISHLFGGETAKALRDLIDLLSDTGARAAVNPDHLSNVMRVLTKVEGSANNLRGALFELVAGSLLKDIEGGFLRTGEKLQDPETGRRTEVDVLLDRQREQPILIVECKAKIPSTRVHLDEVQKWYSDRVPLIYKILNGGKWQGRQFHFELWSNGHFDADALKWLSEQETNPRLYSIGYKDNRALKEYAHKTRSGSLRDMLNEHYFHHPLDKVQRRDRA